MKNIILGIFLIVAAGHVLAQDSSVVNVLTIDDAIAIAMEHNFDIQLAENNIERELNNKSVLNSGYLPTVSASGRASYTNNNSELTFQTGESTNLNGVETQALGASIALDYVLFNGGQRKYTYDKLKSNYELATIQKKVQIENTLIDVYTTFFNVARFQEQKNTLVKAYEVSKERLERVEAQKKYGQKTNIDILNAQVDVNTDSVNLINAQVLLDNSMKNLNFLLGRPIETYFEASKSVELDNQLEYVHLLEQLQTQNNELKQAEINKTISEQQLKINRSGWFPSVSTSVGYGYNYNDNGPAGFLSKTSSHGLNLGINLSWNIFDGGKTKVNMENAKIAIENQKITSQKIQLNLENQLARYWAEYNTQKTIIRNEQINIEISEQNFLKSKELFVLGKVTSLDFRQAQLNLINTQLNLLNAKYNAKIAELQLKKFAGLLSN